MRIRKARRRRLASLRRGSAAHSPSIHDYFIPSFSTHNPSNVITIKAREGYDDHLTILTCLRCQEKPLFGLGRVSRQLAERTDEDAGASFCPGQP